ncbi:head-tail adaptor [Bacillus phage 000TH010]|uniref:Head-to-tail adaptor n=1 Tax=Bacillus phage 000TH010 TaxID=2601652 RepID=A0A5P8PJI7_9CAUD|nr:head-tail adaptor [Bacillus phage 000TH010]QFR56230.1 head-to-tail adaptor [Bacillus phage 000TH010]
MDIQQVKRLNGITNDKYDEYLTEIVPLLVEFAKDECHNPFIDKDGNEKLPAGVKIFVAKAAEFYMAKTGLTGRSMDTVSYNFATELPGTILRNLNSYRKMAW